MAKICKLCGSPFNKRIFIEGKLRDLKNRKYCLDCSPFNSGNNKKLENNKGKTLDQILKEAKCKKKSKYYKWQKKARLERKKTLIGIFGGSCLFCGYNRCHWSLEFHHIDPKMKDNTVSAYGLLKRFEKLIKEIQKCLLVCVNCHREIHAGFIEEIEVKNKYKKNYPSIVKKSHEVLKEFNDRKNSRIRKRYKKKCPICLLYFETRNEKQVYCSDKCLKFVSRKVEWPDKEKLIELIKDNTIVKISKMYNVCDNTIRNWAKYYNLNITEIKSDGC